MERCPCCNARLRERTVCSRCKSDLSVLISSEKAAQHWLGKSIHTYESNDITSSIAAIKISLSLKNTRLALAWRGFLIQHQCTKNMQLLAEQQLIFAKQTLYATRMLFSHSKQLQRLNSFTDYLLAQSAEHSQQASS